MMQAKGTRARAPTTGGKRWRVAFGMVAALTAACARYSSNDAPAADAGWDAGLDAAGDVARDAIAPADARDDAARDAGSLSCTEFTGAAAMLAIQNELDQPVTALWLRYDADAGPGCREATVGRVEARSTSYFTTYVGHAWAIRSVSGNALLKAFVVPVTDAGILTVVVP